MSGNNQLAMPANVLDVIQGYAQAKEKTEQAFGLLKEVKSQASKNGISSYTPFVHFANENLEAVLTKLRIRYWRRIIEVSKVSKVMSVARMDELDKRIDNKDMPEITLAAVGEMLLTARQNRHDMLLEILQEAYDILRPQAKKYKSNNKEAIKPRARIILPNALGTWYSEDAKQRMLVVDRAMHLLDGKELPDSKHKSPLVDAVYTPRQDEGTNAYWKWRKFDNGNVHLWPLRDDLVNKMNKMLGATSLGSGI